MTSRGVLDSLNDSIRPAVLDRRSVLLLLEEDWHLRRSSYWSRLFLMMRPGVSALVQIPFAESLVRLAVKDDDLRPLVVADGGARVEVDSAYRFVCQFATAYPDLVAPAPWLRLCLAASEAEHRLAIAATLLHRLLGKAKLDPGSRRLAAEAARAVLAAASSRGLEPMALGAVIDTLDVALPEGLAAIRRLIGPPHNTPHQRETVRTLASHLPQLSVGPDIVAALYTNAVREEADEEARQRTEFRRWYELAEAAQRSGGPSPPVPSRQRIYDSMLDHWFEQYVETFLQAAPLVAVRACVEAARYWERITDMRGAVASSALLTTAHGSFSIDARTSDELHRHSRFLIEHLLDAIGPAIDTYSPEVRNEVFQTLVSTAAPALVWATLIQHAQVSAATREEIVPLLSSPVALRLLGAPIANLVQKTLEELSPEVTRAIADAVGSLNEESDRYTRARLEKALGVSPPVSPRGAGSNGDGAEDGEDDEHLKVLGPGDEDDTLDIARLGVSREQLAQPANAEARAATRVVWKEIMRLEPLRQTPKEASEALASTAGALHRLRDTLRASGIAEAIEIAGWSAVAHLASLRIIVSGSTDGESDVYEAARRDDGRPFSSGDLLNGGQAFPRAEAVPGLLALSGRHARDQATSEIERLTKDGEAAVRYQVAWRLRELATLGRDRVWPILVRLLQDPNTEVAAAAVSELNAFYKLDHAAAVDLAVSALARFGGASKADHDGRTDALMQLVWQHLARANSIATDAVSRAVTEIQGHPFGIHRVLHSFRDWLVMRGDDEAEEAARARTVELFVRIARASMNALPAAGSVELNPPHGMERDPHAKLVGEIASQLYFASGAFRAGDEPRLPDELAARFYRELRDVLLELGASGVIEAANRVLETLEYIRGLRIEGIDRRDVLDRFLNVGEALIRAGAANAYWLLDPIEHVLRECVAERDPSLGDDAVLGAWSRILDPLIRLGWDQAYRLARDLDLSI